MGSPKTPTPAVISSLANIGERLVVSRDNHAEMLEILKRTHGIFVGIKGKDLTLITCDPPGRTDTETFIAVPLEDPQADLVHKHEWQHVFFLTDLRARLEFVKLYADRILIGTSVLSGTGRAPPGTSSQTWDVADVNRRLTLETFLHSLCNGIDDIRVASLWHQIYPHSAEAIEDRWRTILLTTNRFKEDIILYVMAHGLGITSQQMGPSRWSKWDQLLIDNMSMVKGKGFPAVLVAARVILDHIIADVMMEFLPPQPAMGSGQPGAAQGPAPPRRLALSKTPKRSAPDPAQAQGKPESSEAEKAKMDLLDKLVKGSEPTTKDVRFADTPEVPKTPDQNFQKTKQTVSAALGVSTEAQIEFVMAASQRDMEAVLNSLRSQNSRMTNDQRLLQGLDGVVKFRDVLPSTVLEQELGPEDVRLISTLRRTFVRLMDRVKRVLSDSGSTLNPAAYIDLMLGNSNGDVFEEDMSTKGFSALILIDMSGSMRDKWVTVSRTSKCLAKALKFPFSDFEVWGFSSDRADKKAVIFRFQDVEKGYDGDGVIGAWGLTPMHLAIEVAIRKMKQMPGSAKHLFVLTDGLPTHVGGKHVVTASHGDLVRDIQKSVRAARQDGVNVVGLVIGGAVGDRDANTMFGGQRFWQRTEAKTLFKNMTDLVSKAFAGYLRGK